MRSVINAMTVGVIVGLSIATATMTAQSEPTDTRDAHIMPLITVRMDSLLSTFSPRSSAELQMLDRKSVV